MSYPHTLSLETARTLALYKQGLHRRPAAEHRARSAGRARFANRGALLEIIRRIGLLQLDSISVVARSHYLVMLSRAGLYEPADLDALLHPERQLFEGWAHAACLIPAEDYPHFRPKILARRRQELGKWTQERLGDDPEVALGAVLADVRERGPLASRDFEDPRGQRGTWWDWKPAKAALELLFAQGHLMVDRRENFQRYYDLAERVLPSSADLPERSMADYRRWATLRGVGVLGVATTAHVSDYYRLNKRTTRSGLEALAEEGAVLPVEVEGWGEGGYLLPADLPLIAEIEDGAHRSTVTALLSPFDNLIWERARTSALFGFDYRSEMYTPAAQRQYGYYVLPILHRGRLVGRLDPKVDRKAKVMRVRALYLEPDQAVSAELVEDLAGALREFAAFHGSETVVVERSEPEGLGALLARAGLEP